MLVIDGGDQVRLLVRKALEEAGYRVLDAAAGRAGLEMLRSSPADVVILDILAPGDDGLDLIWELRHRFPDIKIVATSNSQDRGLQQSVIMGADITLGKPFGLSELLGCVSSVLGRPDGISP